MAQAPFVKYDGIDDGNLNDDVCIWSQQSSQASLRLGVGSLKGLGQNDLDGQFTQQMQLPGLQVAASSKYSHLLFLDEVEDDGKHLRWYPVQQSHVLRILQAAAESFA